MIMEVCGTVSTLQPRHWATGPASRCTLDRYSNTELNVSHLLSPPVCLYGLEMLAAVLLACRLCKKASGLKPIHSLWGQKSLAVLILSK